MIVKTRANRRKLEFLKGTTIIQDKETLEQLISSPSEKVRLIFRFLLSPISIKKDCDNLIIEYEKMLLKGSPFNQKAVPSG
jgi:hypothetical protein